MVVELLRLREDIFPDYNEEHFVSCLQQRARIVASETVSATGVSCSPSSALRAPRLRKKRFERMQKYLESAHLGGVAAERLHQPIVQRTASAVARGPDFSLNRLYYISDASSPRLRIGVMIDHARPLRRFMRQVIEDIRSCNFATVECVIENCETPARVQTRSAMPIRAARALFDAERRRSLLHDAYVQRLGKTVHGTLDPTAPVDCSDLFENVHRIPGRAVAEALRASLSCRSDRRDPGARPGCDPAVRLQHHSRRHPRYGSSRRLVVPSRRQRALSRRSAAPLGADRGQSVERRGVATPGRIARCRHGPEPRDPSDLRQARRHAQPVQRVLVDPALRDPAALRTAPLRARAH